MKRPTRRPVLALVLAAVLPAVPAAACSYAVDPDYTAGPFPSPLGGAWLVLPAFDDGSVEVVAIDAEGFGGAVVLRSPDLGLFAYPLGDFAVASDGGFRIAAQALAKGESGRFLAAFDAAGRPLGRVEMEGEIFGFDADAVAYAYRRLPDSRLEILHLDAVTGQAREAFVTESVRTGVGSSCGPSFRLAVAAGGAVYMLDRPQDGRRQPGSTQVLRRFSPSGKVTAAWRLPEGSAYRMWSSGQRTFLATSDTATLWSLGADGVAERFAVNDREGSEVQAVADGFVARRNREIVWFDTDGALRSRQHLGATPQGVSWNDLRQRTEDAGAASVETAVFGSGSDADAALAELAAAGPEAVDRLVDWLRRTDLAASSLRAILWPLIGELLAADPDAVALRLAGSLRRVPDAAYSILLSALVSRWERPTPDFVALLEADVLGGDEERRRDADFAFAWGDRESLGSAGERFPASPQVQRRYLEALSGAEPSSGLSPERFFLAQLPVAGTLLDSVLTDRRHPARAAVVAWLEKLPTSLTREAADLGAVGPALARWAAHWSASPDPAVAAAATLLAATLGEPAAVARVPELLAAAPAARADAVGAVVRRLRVHHPELVDAAFLAAVTAALFAGAAWTPETAALLHVVSTGAPGGGRQALVARLADPRVSVARALAVAGLLRRSSAAELAAVPAETWAAVVRSGLAERFFTDAPPADAFSFTALLWDRLEGSPQLRARLEAPFLAACRREMETFTGAQHAAEHGGTCGFSRPGACFEALAESGIGRRVPDAWLTAHVANYACIGAVLRVKARLWPTLSGVAARRGPWPGLDAVLRADLEAAPKLAVQSIDPAVLAALGIDPTPFDPPASGDDVADLPLLVLEPLGTNGGPEP